MNRSVLYKRLLLYTTVDSFFIEPRTENNIEMRSERVLVIHRQSGAISLQSHESIPQHTANKIIYGIIGIKKLIGGQYLMVVTNTKEVAKLSTHTVYKMTSYDIIPYRSTHLTAEEVKENRRYLSMMWDILSTDGFYFSYNLDLTHSLQRLDKFGPQWKQKSINKRADNRFVWNHHVLQDLASNPECSGFTLPVMHGFVGQVKNRLNGHPFSISIIGRRSWRRAGARFNVRGIDQQANAANFVETEQIVEYGDYRCAFVQLRGSIPLLWSQKPNLQWQPTPKLIGSNSEQTNAFNKHMNELHGIYPGTQFIVDLVNQHGREAKVGDALKLATQQSRVQNLIYRQFDFHVKCPTMNWDSLDEFICELQNNIEEFKFFACHTQKQSGYFRTNCMDCLDRTNVVQSLIAKSSLKKQMIWLESLNNNHVQSVENENTVRIASWTPEIERAFKNLWADNGDMISLQYAGTGALKSDFTRFGKVTFKGKIRDGVNAVTRYWKNNFYDGRRQDSIDLFVGNYAMNDNNDNLPSSFARSSWLNEIILGLIFMFLLSLLISQEYALNWLIACVLVLLAIFYFYGDEIVDKPRLKQN